MTLLPPEKESAPPAKIADAWWSVVDIRPAFLSSAIRAHAVDLYKKALDTNSLAGLQKVAAEKRIAEYESSLAASESPAPTAKPSSSYSSSVGTAKYYGVELVGGSVKENKGILSGFANKSYAKVKAPFDPKNRSFEVVIAFKADQAIGSPAGVFCGSIQYGFAPLFVENGKMTMFLSSNGVSWNIASGTPIGLQIQPQTAYRVKVTWDGKEYAWYLGEGSNWRKVKSVPCETPIFGGIPLNLGVGRSLGNPFPGTIDLNKCYICIDGKLWWEGVKGAYHNAIR